MNNITDTQRIEFLEKQNNGNDCIFRQSTTGRGWRLHQTSDRECVVLTGISPFSSVRKAIDYAIMQSMPKIENTNQLDGHNA
jgi:hypothetical protein